MTGELTMPAVSTRGTRDDVAAGRRFRPATWLAIAFVRAWRALISPLYGPVCKFEPSCSAFGLRALQVHGLWRATPMIVWRILRCHPWSSGGYDPVPGTPEATDWERRHPECVKPGWVTTYTATRSPHLHDDVVADAVLPHDHPRAHRLGERPTSVGLPLTDEDTSTDSRGEN